MTLPLPFLFLNTTKATYFESSYIEQTDFSFPLSCAVSLLVDLLVSFFLEIYKLKYEGFFFFFFKLFKRLQKKCLPDLCILGVLS